MSPSLTVHLVVAGAAEAAGVAVKELPQPQDPSSYPAHPVGAQVAGRNCICYRRYPHTRGSKAVSRAVSV